MHSVHDFIMLDGKHSFIHGRYMDLNQINQTPQTQVRTGAAVIILIVGVSLGFLVASLFSLTGMALKLDTPGSAMADIILKTGLLLGTVSFVIPAWFWMKKCGIPLTAGFRFNRVSWLTVFSAVLFAIGLVIVTDTLDRWIAPSINRFLDETIGTLSPELKSERILEQMMLQFKFTNIVSTTLLLLAAVAGAAYCEEMLIRGMFQKTLENRMKALWAILISSAVFAMIHINPWGGIQIFIIALALGIIAWKTDSIVPTIIIHGLNNFIVILFNNLSEEQLLWYGTKTEVHLHVSLAGTILFVVGLWLLFYFKKPE